VGSSERGRSSMYDVRINNQTIGRVSAAEIVRRSAGWKKTGRSVEVAPEGTGRFVSLDEFLRQQSAALAVPQAASPPPAGHAPGVAGQGASTARDAGKYDVRVIKQTLRGFDRAEIERRAATWRKLSSDVGVAPSGTTAFVSLDTFLAQRPAAAGPPAPAGAAA